MKETDNKLVASQPPELPEDGLGTRIRDARNTVNLSLEALSKLTKFMDQEKRGISRPVLSGYEKGTYKPGTRELRVLYETLGTTPNWLVLGNTSPDRKSEFRARFESDEQFYNQLLEAIKRLDSESQNGLANLIFKASASEGEINKMVSSFMALGADISEHVMNLRSDVDDIKHQGGNKAKPEEK